MRYLVISFLIILSTYVGFAQTPVIAHKSHSGSLEAFTAPKDGGFGIPSPKLVKVIKVNDTTVLTVSEDWHDQTLIDTIWNHPTFCNPSLGVDSLKKKFPHLKFQGFEKRSSMQRGMDIRGTYRKSRQTSEKHGFIEPSKREDRHAWSWGIVGIIGICGIGAFFHHRKMNG